MANYYNKEAKKCFECECFCDQFEKKDLEIKNENGDIVKNKNGETLKIDYWYVNCKNRGCLICRKIV